MKNGTWKKLVALALALTLVLAAGVTAGAASRNSGKTKIRSVTGYAGGSAFGLRYTWKAVSGADGYQFCYCAAYTSKSRVKDYKVTTTDKTSVTIELEDYGTVDFRVRAYKVSNGKTVYGPWAVRRVKRSKVDSLIAKQVKKMMKSNSLFMKATAPQIDVHSGASASTKVLTTFSYLDEGRATGKFKRDKAGALWVQVYASISQTKTMKGWILLKQAEPVWYAGS